MDAVVSRFGLKAENSLRVRIDGLPGGLLWVLVFQSHFIASLLLHALRQAADGDLSADAEAVENRNIRTGIRSKLGDRPKRIIQNLSLAETAGMSHPAVMMSGSWGVLGAIFTVIGSKNISSLFTRMV